MNNQNETEAYQTIDIENLTAALSNFNDTNFFMGFVMFGAVILFLYFLFRWLR